MSTDQTKQKTENFWRNLGPGLTTGAADDDPSGIGTYSQAGAQYGFRLLWLAPFTFPLMAAVQEMCARIGLATGRGLAANIRLHYPRWILYVSTTLLFAANTFNIGADLGAMAAAVQLIFPKAGFSFLVIFFALACLGLEIFIPYRKYSKYLKWLSLTLVAYILSGLVVAINWRDLMSYAVFPTLHFTKNEIFLVTGVLGTTISPYLFFWQTSQEVEEEIMAGKTSVAKRQIVPPQVMRKMRADVWTGMFFSNLVMFFIIAVCAAVLWQNGIVNITTAAEAAAALRPLAGPAAYLLFTLGIVGTGLLALPVLAGSASYALSEALGWREGLYRKFRQAHAFYGIMIVAMLMGLVSNFAGLDPMRALIYAAVANGIIAPVILIPVVRMAASEKIMGRHKSGRHATGWGWVVVGLMTAAAVATLISLFF